MSAAFAVSQDGHEYGPFTADQLRTGAASGQIRADAKIRKLPDGQWIAATSVAGLPFAAMPAMPPPIPSTPHPTPSPQPQANRTPTADAGLAPVEVVDKPRARMPPPAPSSTGWETIKKALIVISILGIAVVVTVIDARTRLKPPATYEDEAAEIARLQPLVKAADAEWQAIANVFRKEKEELIAEEIAAFSEDRSDIGDGFVRFTYDKIIECLWDRDVGGTKYKNAPVQPMQIWEATHPVWRKSHAENLTKIEPKLNAKEDAIRRYLELDLSLKDHLERARELGH